MGVAMIRATCLDLTPTRIIYNRSTGPADPQRGPHARATEVATAVFLEPIFRQRSTPWPCKASRRRRHDAKQHHRPALVHSHASTPIPHCTMLPSHHCRCGKWHAAPPSDLSSQDVLQHDAPKEENDTGSAAIVRSGKPRSEVSSGASGKEARTSQQRLLQQGNNARGRRRRRLRPNRSPALAGRQTCLKIRRKDMRGRRTLGSDLGSHGTLAAPPSSLGSDLRLQHLEDPRCRSAGMIHPQVPAAIIEISGCRRRRQGKKHRPNRPPAPLPRPPPCAAGPDTVVPGSSTPQPRTPTRAGLVNGEDNRSSPPPTNQALPGRALWRRRGRGTEGGQPRSGG